MKRLVIVLVILGGLLVAADRGLAYAAGNATARQIRIHEGLSEDPEVRFKGFPFVTQAAAGEFAEVTVTVRDMRRGGVTIDRVDATLKGVEVDLRDALDGRVNAVPIHEGTARMRLTYGDLGAFLQSRPGNVRIVVRDGRPFVVSTFGIPGAGQVEVEGTPSVRVTKTSVRVVVSNVRATVGTATLTASLAATAAARASFTVPLEEMPFGIEVKSAELTGEALLVTATASGLVIDVRQ